jgi:redox-sensitive bicupin YhaK (pirin superfamily)
MPNRTLNSLVQGLATQDGDRIPLTRLVPGAGQNGSAAFQAMDPFLLMDHFGPMVLPPGSDAGFPPHPHKGFQTLTYLIQGAFRHRDSTGGSGLLGPGGAQLMNAGAGIVHEEMPVPEHLETGGPIEGVQLWINLPRDRKLSAPGYTDLQPGDMPWVPVPKGRLKALAGTWNGVKGPAVTPARIAYAHLELDPGGAFAHPLPPGWTAAVAVLHGSILLEGREVPADHVGLLSAEGEGVALEAPGGASLMLLAGEPLREPIAHYGPFVMNTREELEEAYQDYAAGRMGRL